MALGCRLQLEGPWAVAIGLVGVEHFGWPLLRTHFSIGASAAGPTVLRFEWLPGHAQLAVQTGARPCGRSHPQVLPYNSIGAPDKARYLWDLKQNISGSKTG